MIYIADVPSDTQAWLEKPKIDVPEKKGVRRPIASMLCVLYALCGDLILQVHG
jgi:hypothetical protein